MANTKVVEKDIGLPLELLTKFIGVGWNAWPMVRGRWRWSQG
jgi:hypothetical protein